MEKLHIITRCSRPSNILKVKDSIFQENNIFQITWYVIFDTKILKDIDANILFQLNKPNIVLSFKESEDYDYGHQFINDTIDTIKNGWVYILDDDNILHENFLEKISLYIESNKNKRGIIFSQKVGGKDFSKLDIRISHPDNVKVGQIDIAQFILRRDLIGDKRLNKYQYTADGHFITEIFNINKEDFLFVDDILCYYNYFHSNKMPISLPRVLLMGENTELKSKKILLYEEDQLNTIFSTDENINKNIVNFDPDAIVTIGDSFSEFSNLCGKHVDIRKRWVHLPNKENAGEIAYQCSMNYILNNKNDNDNPLVSFFTPFYNTGDRLRMTYESVISQTYTNWEWVLVNDSTDGGKTLKIAEELAKNDSRIKIYDFRQKSGGIIGESKYRAASLSNGKYLMELDHDDILTNDAAELMVKAFKEFPDAKFAFSDCAEIDQNFNSLTYGDGFAFGYGKYRDEVYQGVNYKVAITQNINPKTIRHIVGVPNHFRAWEREFYHSIGGHNRRLTIADDYELIIRSFLKTKFVGVRKLCYLQLFHNSDSLNNTQNSSRADIQRRVRTISDFYNEKIKNRFEELGVKDWAYEENPHCPILTESKFGDEENAVNYIYYPENKPFDLPEIEPILL